VRATHALRARFMEEKDTRVSARAFNIILAFIFE